MSSDKSPRARAPLPDVSTLLIDRNRDRFPDDIVGMFAIPEDLDRETWEAVINASARLGLGTSGFTPPIVDREPQLGRVSVTIRPGDAQELTRLATDGDAQPGRHQPSNPVPGSVDLSDPWSIRGFLADRDGDQAADDAAIHLMLPEDVPFELGAALAEFGARLGVESGALTLPIAGGPTPPGRVPITFHISGDSPARLEKNDDGSLSFSGALEGMAAAIRTLATMSSGLLPDPPGRRSLNWIRRSVAGWTPEGRTASLVQHLAEHSPDRVTILETDFARQQELIRLVSERNPGVLVEPPTPRESVVFDHQWTAEWEVNRLFQALEQEILPRISSSEPIQLIAMISEPPSIRRRVRGQISRLLLQLGFNQGAVHVLDAFKPGLSWLQEVVLPELRQIAEIDRIELSARNWNPDQHEGQLDMSIRWLQELFPGDEILARELGLSLDQIHLSLIDTGGPIYRLAARDANGDILIERSFSPLWRRIDYLAGMPGGGNVTVTTGGIVTIQNGESHRARVLTDPELFWRYMQSELLPKLRRFILTSTGNDPRTIQQPFFEDLLIDVRLSASDQPYGIRDERHSAAEALHEDIYFNVLDFVEEIGRVTSDEKLGAPGSVRPFVTVTPGRQPQARIRLTRRPAGIARIVAQGQLHTIQPASDRLPAAPVISAVEFDDERLIIEVERTPELDVFGTFLQTLANESPGATDGTVIRISLESGPVEIGVPDPEIAPVSHSPAEAPVPTRTIISNPELSAHLNRLERHPEVTVERGAEITWQGRPIPAIAVTSPQSASVWSLRKLSHFKPTMLIVARHHANEVASTTSALQLVEALVGDRTGAAMLAGVNVVILPLENPDGAALHDQLRRENPTWKHHPARYNATGFEFGEDQGNPDSRYGEGRVRDRVWHACLPDIVVDNHGVPSHEWTQLFAGFGSPPRFRVSYWQVQALLYGILPTLDDPAHVSASEAVRDHVATAVFDDEELLAWNRSYADRYRTWGHQWEPERFPLTLHKEMLFHTSTINADSARGQTSYAVRYPRTTILNWVTEVCDETVEGENLERTARAHLLTNKTVLELLREHSPGPIISADTVPSGVFVRTGRQRPIRIETNG